MPIEAPSTQAALAQLTSQGTNAAHTADMAVAIWSAMEEALSPIIGQRGFAALYKRSLQLARVQHVCLGSVQDGVSQTADFSTLKIALAEQTGPDAMAASTALTMAFHDLLVNLIGQSLTDRLLRSVWEKPTSGHPAQDNSP
jgi:hypothetical protein